VQQRKNDRISVIMISGDHRQVQRWEARRWWFTGLIAGVALLATSTLGALMGLYYYWDGYHDTVAIRVENAQFDQERAELLGRIAALESTVETIDRFASRVEQTDVIAPTEVLREGIGPLSESVELPAVPEVGKLHRRPLTFRPESQFSLKGVDDRIASLDGRASRVEQRLQKIHEVKRQRNVFWAALPSRWPVRGWVTSAFGPRRATRVGGTRFHEGIDIAAPVGTPVLATGDGVVTYAGYKGGFGRALIVDHGFGIQTVYGHNSRLLVREGDRVRRGMDIATIGMTGRTTGPHLHYEVVVDGVPVDPMRYLAQRL
jgi:murein DD-endopeptidase MepM/ murein hydrolase activator NlpD